MGIGDAPRSDVERCKAGLPIDSGCGPVRIGKTSVTPESSILSAAVTFCIEDKPSSPTLSLL